MKAVTWIGIILGGLVVLVFLALLLIPMLVDVNQYKPRIESMVAEATGRDFEIGGDLKLSLFPWAGVAFTDLRLGNPKGFEEKDFVSVKAFDAQMKLLPLLLKDVQVKRFVVEGPRIVLVRDKSGRGNWEGLGKPEEGGRHEEKEKPSETRETGAALPLKSLFVGECAIQNGSALWDDRVTGTHMALSDLTIRLEEVSLEKPIRMVLSAVLDGKPLSLDGTLGPLGKEPGKGAMPLDLAVKALDQLDVRLNGTLTDAAVRPRFELAFEVSPFSPRALMAALNQPFPVKTADPKALEKVALKARIKGDPAKVAVSDGELTLDESRLVFSASARAFEKPDVMFNLNLDRIDADRYLPPPEEGKPKAQEKKPDRAEPKKKTDYEPLRKLVLDGALRIGKLKVKNIRVQDLNLKVAAKNGRITLKPCTLSLYEGKVSVNGLMDVREAVPKNQITLFADGIQAGPLIKDFMDKDLLDGTARADVSLRMTGDEPERIKRTLNGKGDLLFKNGAVKGIDLAGMVRNVTSAFGGEKTGTERPKTDFSEFHAPFSIKNGVVDTRNTTLLSPLIRVRATGKTDLVREALDMRVEPKFVGTIKGQGDTMSRAGLTVPILVGGTFKKPTFRPDLKGMLQKNLLEGMKKPEDLKKMLPLKKPDQQGGKSVEDTVKGFIKSLPFGK